MSEKRLKGGKTIGFAETRDRSDPGDRYAGNSEVFLRVKHKYQRQVLARTRRKGSPCPAGALQIGAAAAKTVWRSLKKLNV